MSAFAYDRSQAAKTAAQALTAADGPDAATDRDPLSLTDFVQRAQAASADNIAEILATAAANRPNTTNLINGRGPVQWKGETEDAYAVLTELKATMLNTAIEKAIVDNYERFGTQTWDHLRSTLAYCPTMTDNLIQTLGYKDIISSKFNPTAKAGILTEFMRLPKDDTSKIRKVIHVTRGAWAYREKGQSIQGKDAMTNASFKAMMGFKDAEVADGDAKGAMRKDIASFIDRQGIDESVDLVAYSVRHEIGHAMDKKHSAESAALREAAGWKTVSTEAFVKACEPELTGDALSEAINLLAPFFGGATADSAGGKGAEDGLSKHERLSKTLDQWAEAGKNPTLTSALKMSRVGKSMGRQAVAGGYAQASFLVSSLAILDKALYARLLKWNNPFAMVSSKEWVAEIYAQAMQPGFDVESASHFGAAEKAFIKAIRGE